jgi:predicted nucleic acid-binding protein
LTYILDACALIAFVNEETGEGYEEVDALLTRAAAGEITLYISVVNLVEVYYHCIKKDGEETAEKIMNDVEKLPVTVVDSASYLVSYIAPRLKASYPISLGDAFLCATAASLSAVIVTKDREIEVVEQGERLPVFWIH